MLWWFFFPMQFADCFIAGSNVWYHKTLYDDWLVHRNEMRKILENRLIRDPNEADRCEMMFRKELAASDKIIETFQFFEIFRLHIFLLISIAFQRTKHNNVFSAHPKIHTSMWVYAKLLNNGHSIQHISTCQMNMLRCLHGFFCFFFRFEVRLQSVW